ncbi:hypothetical protein HWV62_1979 [Athelia sp. TMB]|nr:hypothetical protein HWV62_1979 [Athelia sp. TMB]
MVTSCFHCRIFTAIAGDKVHNWLSAPKVSENYTAATDLHLEGTGSWFIDGDEFSDWKKSPEHFLGVYGAREKNSDPGLLRVDNFLRSLLSQLAYRSGGIPSALKDMYRAHGNGREKPSVECLCQTVQLVIAGFDHVYIMIDSLDECGERDKLLQWIKHMASQTDQKLHLLFTSRPEPAIVENLGLIRRLQTISMKTTLIDSDILRYVNTKLSSNNSWNEETRGLIRSALAGRADGVFRWVDLQLQQLKKCYNLSQILEQLKTLPKSLEDSYAKILVNVDSRHRIQLRNILHWLAFSARALKLREIAEVVSVNFEAMDGPAYDSKCRYDNPTTVLTVCSGFVTETGDIVKLAHFSVKEFLMSGNPKAAVVAFFDINERACHSVIAQTCLAYLLNFDKKGSISEQNISSFPLAMYAAEYWVPHLLTAEDDTPPLHNMLLRLFSLPRSDALVNWVQMWDIDEKHFWRQTIFRKADGKIAQPIYYACSVGQIKIVEHLLRDGADPNESGFYGTPLQVALVYNEYQIAKLLLDWNADVTIQAGKYGTALNVASMSGKLKPRSPRQPDVAISQDITPDCSDGAASIEIVNTLLDRGADPNAHAGSNIPLVSAAGFGSLIEIVTLLLDRGADIDAQEYGDTALQHASWSGHLDIMTLLLGRGADVNAQGDDGTALQQASASGHLEIVTLLLDRGADIDAQEYGGTALQQASASGHLEIVTLLLDRGADINAQGKNGTALHSAILKGHLEIVTLLLDRGADMNAQGILGTALYEALSWRQLEIVTLLLDRGADMNAQGKYGTALQGAISSGRLEIVTLLLDHMNAQRINGTALQEAISSGHLEIVTLLLDRGADMNAQGEHDTALQQALLSGHLEIAILLLDRGANVNVQKGPFGNALQAVSTQCRAALDELLVGPSVRCSKDVPSRLATANGYFEVINLLLDHGADVNAEAQESINHMRTNAGAVIRMARRYLAHWKWTRRYWSKKEKVVEVEAVMRLFLERGVTQFSKGEQSLLEEDTKEEFVDAQAELI